MAVNGAIQINGNSSESESKLRFKKRPYNVVNDQNNDHGWSSKAKFGNSSTYNVVSTSKDYNHNDQDAVQNSEPQLIQGDQLSIGNITRDQYNQIL
ncbi:hypothetical protein HAX54_029003 [Datura stramonium]|uniref:Uncharacterized protein n=1 Tax=Datura stramonium TaxID=4076 RepID=A0ABS8V8H9_DATST|nr:hypothetical protein [Datura stramonium]